MTGPDFSTPAAEAAPATDSPRQPAADQPSAPTPAPIPAPPTSESAVTRAVARLEELAERPLAEHPDVYQQVHEALQGALADIDDA